MRFGNHASRHLTYKVQLVLSAWTGQERFLPRASHPLLVAVNLSENCQARCKTCNYWQTTKESAITTERAKLLIDEIAVAEFEYLRWNGGETLLHKDFFDILAHVPRGRFSKVILATNGQLLLKFADKINNSCLTNISVSLDGFGEANEPLRGIDFAIVRMGLDKIVGKRIKIASMFTKYLAHDIDNFLSWCAEKGYDYDIVLPSGVLPYSNTDEIHQNLADMWPSKDEINVVINALTRRNLLTKAIAEGARAYMERRAHPFRRCMIGYTEVRITSDGNVYQPCFELGALGNILDKPLAKILDTKLMARNALRAYQMDCSGCLLGWNVSLAFAHPAANFQYIAKRLRTTRQP